MKILRRCNKGKSTKKLFKNLRYGPQKTASKYLNNNINTFYQRSIPFTTINYYFNLQILGYEKFYAIYLKLKIQNF